MNGHQGKKKQASNIRKYKIKYSLSTLFLTANSQSCRSEMGFGLRLERRMMAKERWEEHIVKPLKGWTHHHLGPTEVWGLGFHVL